MNTKIIISILGLILAIGLAYIIGTDKLGQLSLGFSAAVILALGAIFVVLRKPFLGTCLILFFLSYTYFPSANFGGVTLRIDHFLIILTTLAYLGEGFLKGTLKIQKDPLFFSLFFYLALAISSLTWAINQSRAGLILVFIIFVVLAYELIIQTISDKEKLIKATNFLLWGGLVVSLFGLWQFLAGGVGLPHFLTLLRPGYDSSVFGFPRVHAFSIEPLYFADYLFIPLFLGLALFFTHQEKIKKKWLVTLLLAGLVSFILTLSRGAYLGFIAAGVGLLILIPRKILTATNIIIFLSTIFVVVLLVIGVFKIIGSQYLDLFVSHALVSDLQAGESTQGRLIEYQRAEKVWHEHFWFGVGIGNYGPAINAANPFLAPETGWPIVNNQYLETLAETGVVGMVTLGLFWLLVTLRGIIAFVKSQDPYLKAVLAGLLAAWLGILVQYNFFSTIYIVHIWVLLGLLVATENIALSKVKTENEKGKTTR